MAKYSFEFKMEVVQAYLNAEGGYRYLASKYNIPAKRRIEEWVHAYREFGEEGLMRSRQNKKYTFQFKLSMVELYLSSEVSYQELALSHGISKTPSAASILSAQKQAIEITSDCPYRRTFHSDRGWAYQMGACSSVLKENKIFQSMLVKEIVMITL